MRFHSLRLTTITLVIFCAFFSNAIAEAAVRPKVRAITAFVKIDRADFKMQFADAAKMLQSAKDEFAKAGYEVQTVRVTTQPFPTYVKGMSDGDALAFLDELDKLSKEQDFLLNI